MKKEYCLEGGAGGTVPINCFVTGHWKTSCGSPCTFVQVVFSLILLQFSKTLLSAVIINTSLDQSQQTGQMLALKYFEFKGNNSVVPFLKQKSNQLLGVFLHESQESEK